MPEDRKSKPLFCRQGKHKWRRNHRGQIVCQRKGCGEVKG